MPNAVHVELARRALVTLLSSDTAILAKHTSFHRDFIAGYVAAMEAIDSIDDFADPATWKNAPSDASEGYRRGYEEAIKSNSVEL